VLKSLAILALAFYILPMQTHAQSNETQHAPKSDKPSPSAPPPVVPKQNNSPNLQPETEKHVNADVRVVSAPSKDGYDIAAFWIGAALAIVGVIGIIFAAITLRKIERQTRATEDSVKAQIGADRPWMIPRITQPVDDEVTSTEEPDWTLPIELTFTNLGKTPAIVTGCIAEPSSETIKDRTKTRAPTLILDLVEPPEYENKYGRPGQPDAFAPGAIYVSGERFSLYLEMSKDTLLRERVAWKAGEKCLCMKGFLEYQDVFGKIYRTRFCYAYQDVREFRARVIRSRFTGDAPRPREFRKAGPEAYNKID
jgi:hypothetical protein